MKPIAFKAMPQASLMQPVTVGPVIASVKGVTRKQGVAYANSLVVLYNKYDLQPIAMTRSNELGGYQFNGLNAGMMTYVVAFDSARQFNAVIQDNVVPK